MGVNVSDHHHQRIGKGSEKCAAADGSVRKSYDPPELVIYGSLVELTRSGKNDLPLDIFGGGSVQTG